MKKVLLRSRRYWKPAIVAAVFVLGAVVWTARPTAQGQTGKKDTPAPAVVPDMLAPGVPGQQQVDYINEEIERLWRDNKITPSERCTDYEFIRRASLDLIGRIAKIDEIKKFMADPAKHRRSMLIERLLKHDDFAHNSATIWTTLLMTRSTPKMYRDQMYLFLYDELSEEKADWSKIADKLVTAKGRTNENGAVNFILAHMGEEFRGDRRRRINTAQLWKDKGRFEMVPVTSRTTKLFLGVQTQCTQCHDHPFGAQVGKIALMQKHFWGINAFFRQVDAPQGVITLANKKNMGTGQKELKENNGFNTTSIVPYERRNGTIFYTSARFIDGTKLDLNAQRSRREILSEYITTSPYFGKAFVNRMWGHFMGVSFTKNNPADFGDHNPIITPNLRDGEAKDWLLGRLAKDWTKIAKHDPRQLIRWICNSKVYSLSSVANKSNASRDARPLFGRMLLKAMTPEQLFESIEVAVGYDDPSKKKERKEEKERFLNRLLVNFGDDEGNEQTFNGTVIQALLLMNGQEINKKILDKKTGSVAYAIKTSKTPNQAMHSLFMAALNRPPTDAEYKKILTKRMAALPRTAAQKREEFLAGFYQDMFWAILNSNEFFLNH